MKNNYTLRKLVQEDLSTVAHLFMKVFNDEGEKWSEETALSQLKQNLFGDAHWVVCIDEKIIGFIVGIVLTRENGPELFIDSIAVDKQYRKQGIGKMLWEQAVNYVRTENLNGIRLLAHPGFNSYEWYKAMGFKESGWVELFREY